MTTPDTQARFIELAALQTFTNVNLNRDEQGMPKTATIGDTARTRVSEACSARAIRVGMRASADGLTYADRTRRIPGLIADALRRTDPNATDIADDAPFDDALVVARWVCNGIGLDLADPFAIKSDKAKPADESTKVMLFVPGTSAERIANILRSDWDTYLTAATDWYEQCAAAAAHNAQAKEAEKEAKAAAKAAKAAGETPEKAPKVDLKDAPPAEIPSTLRKAVIAAFDDDGSIDIALMGRMIAEVDEITNTDGAVQIAHWFTVDAQPVVDDFFTAVDDRLPSTETGSGHMGFKSLTSGTFFRWAALDRELLRDNLRLGITDEDLVEELATRAEQQFIRHFVEAVPSGNRKSTGSSTLPSAVTVAETNLPANPSDVYQRPVTADQHPMGIIGEAFRRLAEKDRLMIPSGYRTGKARLFITHPDLVDLADNYADVYDRVNAATDLYTSTTQAAA